MNFGGLEPNGVLFVTVAGILYAALHSFLASPWPKQKVGGLFGGALQPYYRLAYNIIAVLTFLPILAIGAWDPGRLLYQVPFPWSVLFTFGQAFAALLILVGLLQTDIWEFLGFRQLNGNGQEAPAEFKRVGLYQIVRHPLYTAGLLFIWLTPIMTTTSLALTIVLSIYLFVGSYFEEKRLVAEFGDDYRRYQSEVPRIIPDPRSFRRLDSDPSGAEK